MASICDYNLSKRLIIYKKLQPPVFIKCKVILSQGMDFADWGHTRLKKWYLESAFYKGKGSTFYRGSFWGDVSTVDVLCTVHFCQRLAENKFVCRDTPNRRPWWCCEALQNYDFAALVRLLPKAARRIQRHPHCWNVASLPVVGTNRHHLASSTRKDPMWLEKALK